MPDQPTPACILLGRLQRDFLINAQGQTIIDQPGGNLLYAAATYQVWAQGAGLIARVGADFPAEWPGELKERGLDIQGIRVLDEAQDLRRFIAYSDLTTTRRGHPVKQFAKLGRAFPKSLLGYQQITPKPDSKKQRSALSLRGEDIPQSYAGARAAHLCPLDYFSHSLMPAALRQAGVQIITLDAGRGYMHATFWNEFPELVNGLSIFLAEEELLRSLFAGRSDDLWEMAEAVASFNCEAVVIKNAKRGQWLYDSYSKARYHLPAYPAQLVDITGAGSSFCGGFLAGLLLTQDLLRAALYGNATASLAAEGSGAFYVADSLPGLAESRLKSLEQAVQVV